MTASPHEQEAFFQGSSKQLRALFMAMQDVVIVVSPQGRYLEIAPTRPDLLVKGRDDLLGKTIHEVFAPELADFFQQAIDRTLSTGQLVTIEYRVPIREEETWFEGRLSPIFDETGRATSVLLIARDITETWQTRKFLRESEARYRTLVEQSNDAIYFLFDRKFEYINQRFKEIFGVTQEEVTSLDFDFLNLVAPQSRSLVIERSQKVAQGEQVPSHYEFTALTTDGREIEVEASVSYVPYRDGIATQGILRDITERKQSEQALRESEERYRQLVDLMPDGVAVHQDGVVRMVNQTGARLLGYESTAEIVGRPALDFVHPDDRPIVIERMRALLQRKESVPPQEERFLRKDGTITHTEISAGQFLLEGKPAILIISRDISQRKRLEDQLRQAQKMEAVGRLAGGIAHDFNNLLTAISGYAEFILRDLALGAPSRGDAEAIIKAAERATKLIQQLLAFSRHQVMEMRVINLNQELVDLERMLHRIIGEDIDLRVITAPDLWNVRIDPSQMDQVIVNLAVNARDAMPVGGVLILETMNVELEEPEAQQHPDLDPGEYVLLSVTDTGKGIPPAIIEHLFEPFFTTKEVGEGTGLGLAMVYGIVKQFGGHIEVESEVDRGTSFRVFLPHVDQAAEYVEGRPYSKVGLRGSETVLVVEDNDMVRNLAARILRKQGYTVLEAHSGREALRLASEHTGKIHLLLTDVVMPQMSGQALVEQLEQVSSGIRVLFMSGYTDNIIAQHGILEPGTDLIEKPFSPQALSRKVRGVLDQE
jgi:PAS domain S-box-containing protein